MILVIICHLICRPVTICIEIESLKLYSRSKNIFLQTAKHLEEEMDAFN